MTPLPDWDAVVLAGGRATRLGGIDKTALGPAGDTLLDRALRAAAGARRRIVVGPERPAGGGEATVLTREDPPFGGPVAALAAALAVAGEPAPLVAVLAADQPAVEAALAVLLEVAASGAPATDGWVAVDPDGVQQPLLAVYRAAPLAAAVAALPDGGRGAAMRRVLGSLRITEVPLPAALCADVDTRADADRHHLSLP